jgi:hypothetical protein
MPSNFRHVSETGMPRAKDYDPPSQCDGYKIPLKIRRETTPSFYYNLRLKLDNCVLLELWSPSGDYVQSHAVVSNWRFAKEFKEGKFNG